MRKLSTTQMSLRPSSKNPEKGIGEYYPSYTTRIDAPYIRSQNQSASAPSVKAVYGGYIPQGFQYGPWRPQPEPPLTAFVVPGPPDRYAQSCHSWVKQDPRTGFNEAWSWQPPR